MGEKEDEWGAFRGCRIAAMIFDELSLRTIHVEATVMIRCLACQFDYNPSLAQSATTLALVQRSISIRSGQGRSKPSAFHYLVVSMPILLP